MIPQSNLPAPIHKYFNFYFREEALVPDAEHPPSWADCLEAKAFLTRVSEKSQLYLGDLLNYMQSCWHEEYSQALDESDYEVHSLHQYQWVARSVPIENRVPSLSYKHHEIVASLEPVMQKAWLAKAAEKHWSSNEMRTKLQAIGLKQPTDTMRDALHALAKEWLDSDKKLVIACGERLNELVNKYGRGKYDF